jgi:hypothetical protein
MPWVEDAWMVGKVLINAETGHQVDLPWKQAPATAKVETLEI